MERKRAEKQPEGKSVTQRIITAASEVFAEEGFAGARVDEIARRARINKAMLYYHFGDKASLYAAVILSVIHGTWERIGDSIEAASSSEDKLRTLITGIAQAATASPHYPRLILRELATGAINLPEPVLKEWTGIFQKVRALLEEGQRERRFRPVDPLMTHLSIIGSIIVMAATEPVRERIKASGSPGIRTVKFTRSIGEHVADIILNGIKTESHKSHSLRRI
ncbi:MAG: TetR/AcrR family transcriptional regulator [Acidobacteriota bacterium]